MVFHLQFVHDGAIPGRLGVHDFTAYLATGLCTLQQRGRPKWLGEFFCLFNTATVFNNYSDTKTHLADARLHIEEELKDTKCHSHRLVSWRTRRGHHTTGYVCARKPEAPSLSYFCMKRSRQVFCGMKSTFLMGDTAISSCHYSNQFHFCLLTGPTFNCKLALPAECWLLPAKIVKSEATFCKAFLLYSLFLMLFSEDLTCLQNDTPILNWLDVISFLATVNLARVFAVLFTSRTLFTFHESDHKSGIHRNHGEIKAKEEGLPHMSASPGSSFALSIAHQICNPCLAILLFTFSDVLLYFIDRKLSRRQSTTSSMLPPVFRRDYDPIFFTANHRKWRSPIRNFGTRRVACVSVHHVRRRRSESRMLVIRNYIWSTSIPSGPFALQNFPQWTGYAIFTSSALNKLFRTIYIGATAFIFDYIPTLDTRCHEQSQYLMGFWRRSKSVFVNVGTLQ